MTFNSLHQNTLSIARGNKRSHEFDGCSDESLISQMKELSIDKVIEIVVSI